MEDAVDELIDTLEREAAGDGSTAADVGIVMGSDSDLPVMRGAHEALNRLGFEEVTGETGNPGEPNTYESYVVSAHRTPEILYAYGRTASDRGVRVIIAGAGGKSADLPNMMASIAYPIPVIGVPIDEKSVDSVIGMPTGAPILAVDAGKAFNAGLSAVQILALADASLWDELRDYRETLRAEVAAVSQDLHARGVERFLDEREDPGRHK